jgi:hypothetical protein
MRPKHIIRAITGSRLFHVARWKLRATRLGCRRGVTLERRYRVLNPGATYIVICAFQSCIRLRN